MKNIMYPDTNCTEGITIIGNGHWRLIVYAVPEWDDDNELHSCFRYKGELYFLEEFMRIQEYFPAWMHEFHGHMNDTFFSGLLIKLSDCGDAVQVYRFYS